MSENWSWANDFWAQCPYCRCGHQILELTPKIRALPSVHSSGLGAEENFCGRKKSIHFANRSTVPLWCRLHASSDGLFPPQQCMRWIQLPSLAFQFLQLPTLTFQPLGQTSELDISGKHICSLVGASNKSWVALGWRAQLQQFGLAEQVLSLVSSRAVLRRNCSVCSLGLVETQTSSFYIRSDSLLTSDAPPLFQNDEDYQSAAQVYDTPAVFLHPVLELVFR